MNSQTVAAHFCLSFGPVDDRPLSCMSALPCCQIGLCSPQVLGSPAPGVAAPEGARAKAKRHCTTQRSQQSKQRRDIQRERWCTDARHHSRGSLLEIHLEEVGQFADITLDSRPHQCGVFSAAACPWIGRWWISCDRLGRRNFIRIVGWWLVGRCSVARRPHTWPPPWPSGLELSPHITELPPSWFLDDQPLQSHPFQPAQIEFVQISVPKREQVLDSHHSEYQVQRRRQGRDVLAVEQHRQGRVDCVRHTAPNSDFSALVCVLYNVLFTPPMQRESSPDIRAETNQPPRDPLLRRRTRVPVGVRPPDRLPAHGTPRLSEQGGAPGSPMSVHPCYRLRTHRPLNWPDRVFIRVDLAGSEDDDTKSSCKLLAAALCIDGEKSRCSPRGPPMGPSCHLPRFAPAVECSRELFPAAICIRAAGLRLVEPRPSGLWLATGAVRSPIGSSRCVAAEPCPCSSLCSVRRAAFWQRSCLCRGLTG